MTSRPIGDGFAVRTGILDNTQNGVVCDACGDDELAEVIAWLGGRPAQWYVSSRDGLHEQLLAAGATAETSSVVMGAAAADLDLAPRERAYDVRAVESEPELDAWLGVAEDWGLVDGPQGRASRRPVLLGLSLPRPAPVLLQVAWEGDLAIGAIAARRHDEVLLIEHLGVRTGSQRRGIGRALIAAAVHAEPSAVEVVLGPTPSSIAFYERLGFVLQRFPPNRTFYLPATADAGE